MLSERNPGKILGKFKAAQIFNLFFSASCFFLQNGVIINFVKWGYSSVGRAIRSQRIGQGFESPYLHFFYTQI